MEKEWRDISSIACHTPYEYDTDNGVEYTKLSCELFTKNDDGNIYFNDPVDYLDNIDGLTIDGQEIELIHHMNLISMDDPLIIVFYRKNLCYTMDYKEFENSEPVLKFSCTSNKKRDGTYVKDPLPINTSSYINKIKKAREKHMENK